MISAGDIDRLVAIVRSGVAKNTGAGVSKALTDAGHPTRKGWSGTIPSGVRDRLKRVLSDDHGVPIRRFSDMEDPRVEAQTRRAALENSRYEKKAERVQKDRVMIKPSSGEMLNIDGRSCYVPDGCSMSVPVDLADRIKAPGIILVENLEVFQDFHLLDFEIPHDRRQDLIVFRGKPHVASQDTAEAFLKRVGVPVAACFDIDPSGLSNALSTPHFRDILWPGRDALMDMKRLWRPDRYQAQRQLMSRLEGASGELAKARDFLREAGAGVMQEGFLSLRKDTRCMIAYSQTDKSGSTGI